MNELIEKEIILFADMLALTVAVIKQKNAIIADYQRHADADPDKTDAEHMEEAIKRGLARILERSLDKHETKEA